jgi:hypothetical protein
MSGKQFAVLSAAILFAAGLSLAAPAAAETRIFLLDGQNGYGIDTCLASGEQCGAAAAAAICRAREYVQAVDFGRIDPNELTGAVPDGKRPPRCEGRGCPETVAITCTR